MKKLSLKGICVDILAYLNLAVATDAERKAIPTAPKQDLPESGRSVPASSSGLIAPLLYRPRRDILALTQ